MTLDSRTFISFTIMGCLLLLVGFIQSWNVAFGIFNLCLICAIMSLGVNIQWGYGGLFNVGIMGFAALGGMAAMLTSKPPIPTAWSIAGYPLLLFFLATIILIAGLIILLRFLSRSLFKGGLRTLIVTFYILFSIVALRFLLDPAVLLIESDNPAKTGYLGGLGLPIIFSWIIGALLAASAAWFIGKVALGLRSDYLAIATLGISEIIIALIKNEDWLTRGVKNVTGLSRPVPYEVDLQSHEFFVGLVEWFYASNLSVLDSSSRQSALQDYIISSSSLLVKFSYSILFMIVLLFVYFLCSRALNSGWGRMMRAIRDNEESAESIGKDVTRRHLQLFILGSSVVGLAGAMLTTLDGQFTPGTYHPLRYTFLIWVMVIVGGSGSNSGSVLGGFLIWFLWIESEPLGQYLISLSTSGLSTESFLRSHLSGSAQYMRLIVMGLILLLVMRLRPGGLLPERVIHKSS